MLADSEREAVADLLGFLENVLHPAPPVVAIPTDLSQRADTDFFSGEPLRALSTLVYSDNIDLQRSASLTFAEITERGIFGPLQDPAVPSLMTLQMCEKSTVTHWSPSCSSSRTRTSRSSGLQAQLWATSQ